MATRQLLAELCDGYFGRSGVRVVIESVGGVDAARRVQAGEAFDVVVLGSEAIDKLMASGHLRPGSRVDLVRSRVAACVPADAATPDLSTEAGLRQALDTAGRIGFSTGPSGVALQKLFQRWGIDQAMAAKTVQAPPGVPVASLVAQGAISLGFQQLSELLDVPGITVVDSWPSTLPIVTTFSAGVTTHTLQADAVQAWLTYLSSREADAAKLLQGMEPA